MKDFHSLSEKKAVESVLEMMELDRLQGLLGRLRAQEPDSPAIVIIQGIISRRSGSQAPGPRGKEDVKTQNRKESVLV